MAVDREFEVEAVAHGVPKRRWTDLRGHEVIEDGVAREMREIAMKRYPMVRAVPMRGLPQALHEVYGQATGVPVSVNQGELGRKATLGGSLNPTIGAIQQEPMRPTPVARDREFKIVQGPNGPVVDKA